MVRTSLVRLLISNTLLLFTAGHTLAGEVDLKEKIINQAPQVLKLLRSAEGHAELTDVRDLSSLYELTITTFDGRKIAYLTKDMKYLILGSIFDKEGHNLTRLRLTELNRIDFGTLPLGDALRYMTGNGTRKLALFIDPLCPYCRSLLDYLKGRENYEIYMFFNPISEKSFDIIRQLLCLREQAINLLLTSEDLESVLQKKGGETKCEEADTLLEKHLVIGQTLRVRAVPFVILEDGSNFYGFNKELLDNYLKK